MTPLEVFASANDVLQDTSFTRWPQDERLRYLNDGRRAIAVVRPDLFATIETVTLVAGARQSLPEAGFQFFDAIRNINSDGSPGSAVRIIEREALDAFRPGWHSEAPGSIKNFMIDERTPDVYYVYPPAAAGQKLEISYALNPTPVQLSEVSTFQLTREKVYAGLLADYIIHRAYLKDAEYAGNGALSQQHYQLFMAGLGVGGKRLLTTSPNAANMGGVPSRIGVEGA